MAPRFVDPGGERVVFSLMADVFLACYICRPLKKGPGKGNLKYGYVWRVSGDEIGIKWIPYQTSHHATYTSETLAMLIESGSQVVSRNSLPQDLLGVPAA